MPAPNNEILRELALNGIYIDLDALRGHLRNLYAKFGVEDGLNPAQQRARLAELVYEHGVIEDWGPREEAAAAPALPPRTTAMSSPMPPAPPETSAPPSGARLPGPLRHRWWLAAGLVVLALAAIVTVVSLGDDPQAPPRPARDPGPPVINPASMADAEGTVTYCTGADTVTSEDGRTQHQTAVDAFNDRFEPNLHATCASSPTTQASSTQSSARCSAIIRASAT